MKKIRYNKVMKTHKKLLIVAATVLVVGGAGTVGVFALQDEPKKVATEQSASVEPQNEPVEVVEEQEVVTEPVEQEEQPVETAIEQAERLTREHATRYGLSPDQQWLWMSAHLTGSDDEQISQYVNNMLSIKTNTDGTCSTAAWDGVTRVRYLSVDCPN
jgi:hypothetical protein